MRSPTNPAASRRIPELDGWRGLSILGVVIGHLVNVRYTGGPDVDTTNLASVMANWGVRIFFIVSGFIITRLALQELTAQGHFSVARFYVRRAFRIVPAFYFYLLCIALFAGLGLINQSLYGTALAATFICNFSNSPCDWFAGHSWTLSFEEQFYLIFPIIIYLSGQYFGKAVLSILGILMIFPFIRYFMHLGDAWYQASGMCLSFSLICVGAVFAAYEAKVRELATGRRNVIMTAAAAAVLVVTGTVSSLVSFPLRSLQAYVQAGVTDVLLPPCLAWIVLSLVYREGYLSGLLRSRIVQFFGLISYSLYLWQQAFTANVIYYKAPSWLLFPPLMLVAAVLSYYGIERPCTQLGRRLLARGGRPALTAADANEKAIAG
ncbi:MAG TPA: acyltransferase [Stellaceae bacterium]|nr:acyltransferase [Stellaceae bacterium]